MNDQTINVKGIAMTAKVMKYIIVRHSAFGYRSDPRFERGLEVRSCSVESAERFAAKGAVVFDTYTEAQQYAQKEAYPGGTGLPNAPGMFMRATVDGLQVYQPVP